MRAESCHPDSTKAGRLQEGVKDLLMEENPVWAITQTVHAATSQLKSGQPYSAAKVVKATCCPPQEGQSCREADPVFTVGKTKGLPLPWEIIQFPQTPVLKDHFPFLPPGSCSSTSFDFCCLPEMSPSIQGSSASPSLALSVCSDRTAQHCRDGAFCRAAVVEVLSLLPRQLWEYSASRHCPLGAGLCLCLSSDGPGLCT